MKKTKRLLAIFFAVVLTLAMSISVFAATIGTDDGNISGNGKIEITNATIGKEYTIYKIFDTDSTGKGNITATKEQKEFYMEQTGNPFAFTKNAAGSYNVSIGTHEVNGETVTYTDSEVIAFLQGFVTKGDDGNISVDFGFSGVVDASSTITAESTTVTFNGIPYGYYLVTSSLGAVITVDSTNSYGTVIDKNQNGGSNFTKSVADSNKVIQIGEVYTYTLEFQATNYDGETEITEYIITDTLGKGINLSYSENDPSYGVNIQVGDNTVNNASVTYSNGKLNIKIPWVDSENKFLYESPSTVKITYNAVLTADADIQEDIVNAATLTWNGKAGDPSKADETVQTYALAIMKVDDKGNALAGAEFTVTDAAGNSVNVSPVEDEAGVYVVDPVSGSNTVVSPGKGLIVIKGVDNIAYTLTESKAPDGYNLLKDSVTVTPEKDGSKTITIYYDGDGNVIESKTENYDEVIASVPVTAKVIVNQEGSLLPSTGGMGTTALYVAGIALVIGAGVVLVVRRRMNAQ